MTAPQKPDDESGTKGLVKDALSGPSDPSLALQEYLARSETDSDFARIFLVRAMHAPQAWLARIEAFQQQLDVTKGLDETTRKSILVLKRQLEQTLPPTPGAGIDGEFDVPERFRRGALTKNQKASVDSAVDMIAAVARELGVDDLSGTSILDIGCGVKFTQAFYGRKVPVKRYHGVDVDPGLIEFLSSNVKDDRLSYKHIDIYNARYHKTGQPLSVETDIGVRDETFDLVSLFSVFTHLAPPDYRTMLELARRYILPTGTFIFTTFIDETIPDFFKDSDPEKPLLMALYKESAVREFAAAAGWSMRRIFLKRMQHWIVCDPA